MALKLLKSYFHVYDLKVTIETARVAYSYKWEEKLDLYAEISVVFELKPILRKIIIGYIARVRLYAVSICPLWLLVTWNVLMFFWSRDDLAGTMCPVPHFKENAQADYLMSMIMKEDFESELLMAQETICKHN